ncbi:MAG: hypothetical protein QXZ20_03225, partial [Candidatus Aenigmatarchaeota archaeon]
IGQRAKPEIKLLEDAEKAINNEMKEKIEKLPQAIAYANDIYLAIKEMYRVAKENAKISIVIGDGVFVEEEVVIKASNLLNSIASYIGYEIKKTLIVNKRIFTTPERKKKGIIKEYILIWEK